MRAERRTISSMSRRVEIQAVDDAERARSGDVSSRRASSRRSA
jgi:hypothetical protein